MFTKIFNNMEMKIYTGTVIINYKCVNSLRHPRDCGLSIEFLWTLKLLWIKTKTHRISFFKCSFSIHYNTCGILWISHSAFPSFVCILVFKSRSFCYLHIKFLGISIFLRTCIVIKLFYEINFFIKRSIKIVCVIVKV